jgi:hypothetical protein
MNIKQKKKMFGDLIVAGPESRGAGRNKLVINLRPVVFRDKPHFSISFAKGRFV